VTAVPASTFDRPRDPRGPVAFARRALHALAWCAVASAVLLIGFIGIGPETGKYRVLTVLSGSMRPTLPVGALVVVTPEPLSALRPGQVITFHRPLEDHEVVTHRVVSVGDDHGHPVIETKGDANAAPDPWKAVLQSGPVWKVRFVAPGLGHVLALVRGGQIARIGLIVVPLLLAATWLAQIWIDPSDGDPVVPDASDDADADDADADDADADDADADEADADVPAPVRAAPLASTRRSPRLAAPERRAPRPLVAKRASASNQPGKKAGASLAPGRARTRSRVASPSC